MSSVNQHDAPAFPANLSERIEDGVFSLGHVPRATLISWSRQAARQCDKDALGDAIMYGGRSTTQLQALQRLASVRTAAE